MVVVQASKLNLPHPASSSSSSSSLSSSPQISCVLFDPHSLSLALMHPDSSFSLYPSLSPLCLTSLPPPQTLVPPPASSAAFLRLDGPSPSSPPRVLFLAASPLRAGAAVLLRFWILLRHSQTFAKARVICNQKILRFDENKSGVVFSVKHGVSVKLVASINVFVMYAVSIGKIWVFAAKMADGVDDGVNVKLMMCAVVDCRVPVFAISVSFGYLILGEENGVRVSPLRPLVKGRVKKHRQENRNLSNGLTLPNGLNQTINGLEVSYRRSSEGERRLESSSNGYLEGKSDKHSDSVKLKSVKVRLESKGGSACFVAFQNKEVESYKRTKVPLQSAKAISIQALSPNKFLLLDSAGQLQLLCLSNPVLTSEIPWHMKQLTNTMKVEKLAVLPDSSTRTQTVWISDGCHTVHMLAAPDMDSSVSDSNTKDNDETLTGFSVSEAIFANEKIQDVIPLSTNAILILGQGSLSAYTIS